MQDVRALAPLWPLRQRRNAVLVLRDDGDEYERAAAELVELDAVVLVEREPGELSAALGRPAVVVVDRFGTVGLRAERPALTDVRAVLEGFELACPECGPQAWGDPGA